MHVSDGMNVWMGVMVCCDVCMYVCIFARACVYAMPFSGRNTRVECVWMVTCRVAFLVDGAEREDEEEAGKEGMAGEWESMKAEIRGSRRKTRRLSRQCSRRQRINISRRFSSNQPSAASETGWEDEDFWVDSDDSWESSWSSDSSQEKSFSREALVLDESSYARELLATGSSWHRDAWDSLMSLLSSRMGVQCLFLAQSQVALPQELVHACLRHKICLVVWIFLRPLSCLVLCRLYGKTPPSPPHFLSVAQSTDCSRETIQKMCHHLGIQPVAVQMQVASIDGLPLEEDMSSWTRKHTVQCAQMCSGTVAGQCHLVMRFDPLTYSWSALWRAALPSLSSVHFSNISPCDSSLCAFAKVPFAQLFYGLQCVPCLTSTNTCFAAALECLRLVCLDIIPRKTWYVYV